MLKCYAKSTINYGGEKAKKTYGAKKTVYTTYAYVCREKVRGLVNCGTSVRARVFTTRTVNF